MSEIKVDLKLNSGSFHAGINQVQSSLSRLRTVLADGTIAIYGLHQAFSAVAGTLSKAADMQTLETSFSVLTGSMSKAQDTLAKLTRFAATTPFELPELATAGQQLLAFGFGADEVVRVVNTLGDVASGSGQKIGDLAYLFGTARVQGRLFMQDINQYTNRGVPVIEELAKVLGVAESEVRALVTAGKVGFPELNQAFQNMTAEGGRFSGMMEAQSATWNGMLSNLQDSIDTALRAFGQPIIDGLTPALEGMIEGTDRLSNAAGMMGGMVANAAGGVRQLMSVATSLAPVLLALAVRGTAVEMAISRMGAAMLRPMAASFAGAMNRILVSLFEIQRAMINTEGAAGKFRLSLNLLATGGRTAFAALGTAAKSAGAAIMSAFGPVGWIIMGVTAAIQGLISMMSRAKAEAEAIQSLENDRMDIIGEFQQRAQNMKSEEERKQLLEEFRKRARQFNAQLAAGGTKNDEAMMSKFAEDAARLENVIQRIGLKPGAEPVGSRMEEAKAIEEASKESERALEDMLKRREQAAKDLAKWQESEELAAAEKKEEQRKILMSRSGFDDVSAIDARIKELARLLSTGNASTSAAEISEMQRLQGILSRVRSIDRDLAREARDKDQKTAEEKNRADQKTLNNLKKQHEDATNPNNLPRLSGWADSARRLGLGGRGGDNSHDIAKIQAQRQAQGNDLLKQIRDLLKKNPKLVSEEAVFG